MRLLTVDDVLSTLSHTALPSLVVEGGSDAIVLRGLEHAFPEAKLSVLPVGGKDTVLGIFDRRAELRSVQCVLFFVDKDFWLYSSVPPQYADDDILTTAGYSIENDMYEDGKPERLLTPTERTRFLADLDHFLDWFSNQVSWCLAGQPFELSSHPNHILGQARPVVEDCSLRDQIAANYQSHVRGRSLFAIILRQLSRSKRASKYSSENLLELGATAEGPNFMRIRDWVSERLSVYGCR